MKLIVKMPAGCEAEKTYIVQVILGEFLGIDFALEFLDDLSQTYICFPDGSELVVQDIFFNVAKDNWLAPESLPSWPICKLRLNVLPMSVPSLYDDLPILFGGPRGERDVPVVITSTGIRCDVDIFGSSFFLLSRYEEAVLPDRNQYDQFAYTASILSRDGLVMRPLVNDYVELLWACLSKLCPNLVRAKRSYRFVLTHDVDRPFSMRNITILGLIRKLGSALLYYRSLDLAIRRLSGFVHARRGNYDADSFNTFDFIMDVAERHGMRSAFYFITDHSAGQIDGDYAFDDPWIRRLLKKIHSRGHEIGLHGSYGTLGDATQFKREVGILKSICSDEKIKLDAIGGRQHYLHWSVLDSWDMYAQAGLTYDSTLGFAEHAGFRAGMCHEYTAYSLRQREPLRLKERPMIVMDGTLTATEFMGLSLRDAKPLVLDLIKTCKYYGGDFVCLFHNSNLETGAQKRFFTEIVVEAA